MKIKYTIQLLFLLLLFSSINMNGQDNSNDRLRVIVSTDIGGSDNDDYQSMVHFLVYSDVLDVEGLVSSPWEDGRKSHILEVINEYEKDYFYLSTYSADYPTPNSLREITKQGAVDITPYPGYSVSTEGSDWIVQCARRPDSRPLYILVWGCIDDVVQALHDAPDIESKIRVYWIGGPNKKYSTKAYAYLTANFKDLWFIEANTTYRGMFVGGDQSGDLSNAEFVSTHVRKHGALGNYFYAKRRNLKAGDTPSVLYVLNNEVDTPTKPGWGGAFVPMSGYTNWWTDNSDAALSEDGYEGAKTVNIWREQFLRDFQARMDRCNTIGTTYSLTTSVTGQGSVSPSSGSYASGTALSLTASPAIGWQFSGWSGALSGTSNPVTLTMSSDKSVTANFTKSSAEKFNLTTSVTGQGSVSPSSGTYSSGSELTLIATPADNWKFVNWTGDASGTSATITITMDSDKSLTANFEADETGGGCDSPVTISTPFSKDGAGEFCWQTTDDISYVNSWNLAKLEINGVDFTNTWSSEMPPKQDGYYNIHYLAEYSWAHFEIASAKSAEILEGDKGKASDFAIHCYPNPVGDKLNIQFSKEIKEIVDVYLIDVAGKVVLSDKAKGLNHTLDMSGLPIGLYTVKLSVENQGVTELVVKN